MKTARTTARGIVLKGDKILLIERYRGGKHYFSIPGGGVESGEETEETAEREIWEETSIKVNVGRLLYDLAIDDYRHLFYLCEYVEGEPELHPDSPEALFASEDNKHKPVWRGVAEFKDLPLVYWEPLRRQLSQDLKNGFSSKTKVMKVKGK